MCKSNSELDKLLFLERIKKLIADNGATCKELDEYVWSFERYGISHASNEPTLKQAILLADYFDVSLDYLVGRSDDPQRH